MLAVTFALERRELSGPLAYAELARTLGVQPGEGAPLADVREAVLGLRRGKGMVLDPDDPDSVSAGSFFTNPILSADAFAALEQRAPERPPRFPEDDGRVKTSAAWLIERAGFQQAATATRRGSRSPPSTRSRSPTAAPARPPSCSRSPARSRAACDERFGVRLEPEPTLVGVEWP